jgi:hypothetical protein
VFVLTAEDSEVPFIERQNISDAMALREYDDRCVGQADTEVGVVIDEPHVRS